jgi:hypothetical protein
MQDSLARRIERAIAGGLPTGQPAISHNGVCMRGGAAAAAASD